MIGYISSSQLQDIVGNSGLLEITSAAGQEQDVAARLGLAQDLGSSWSSAYQEVPRWKTAGEEMV
jgi:hypothetical protein